MKFRVLYRRARLTVEGKPTHTCQACGAGGRTELHHLSYAYPTAEVRKNHQLALENTIELCYLCHRVANALYQSEKDINRCAQVSSALFMRRLKKEEVNHALHNSPSER